MGRQAHLTLLALGRSPFEPPELDDAGNFVLGPHAHDVDNAGEYTQRFDDRGHPENQSTRSLDRELRSAKNDVLETAGVVKRKSEAARAAKQQQIDRRILVLGIETNYGAMLPWVDMFLRPLMLWWIQTLRNHIQTFRWTAGGTVAHAIISEIRTLGVRRFLLSGFVTSSMYGAAEFSAAMIVFLLGYDRRKVDVESCTRQGRCMFWILDKTLLLLLLPTDALASLCGLQLVPSERRVSLLSYLPFAQGSPIQFPPPPTSTSLASFGAFALGLCSTPLVLGMVRHHLQASLETTVQSILRHTTTQPRSPDLLSVHVAHTRDVAAELMPTAFAPATSLTPPAFLTVTKVYVPHFGEWLEWMLHMWRLRSRSETTEDIELEAMLRVRASQLYRSSLRAQRHSGEDINESQNLELQRNAVSDAWQERGLYLPEDSVNMREWMAMLDYDVEDESTATPDPHDMFHDENRHVPGDTDSDIHPVSDGGNGVPIDVEGADDGIEPASGGDVRNDGSQAPYFPLNGRSPTSSATSENVREETPSPGITRAQSLDLQLNSPLRQRPRRRFNVNSSTENNGWSAIDGSRPPATETQCLAEEANRGPRECHRVTLLSALAADTFAYHAAKFLTTAILLPIEAMYLRSLALAFLANPANRNGAAAGTIGIWGDVRPVGEFLGGPGGRLRYMGNMVLLLGMQGVVSSMVWGSVTVVAIRAGRTLGWGQF